MRTLLGPLTMLLAMPAGLSAQEAPAADLAALVAEARSNNPEIQSALRLADAAAARVPQAGAPPDPTLSAGIMWVPVSSLSLTSEQMTMGSIDLFQRIPALGTLSRREAMAQQAHEAAIQDAAEAEVDVVTRLKGAYYDLLFANQAIEVLERNHAILVDFAGIARTGFAVGRAPQQDVLRAQTEISRLDEQTAGLRARRSAALAELNEILQRPSLAPIEPTYPEPVRRLALSSPPDVAFTAASLDGGLGNGFPSLEELQAQAVRARPMLRAHEHRIEEQYEGVRLAERERWPDLGVMLSYAPRFGGRSDLVTAMFSVDLPVFAGRKQKQAVVEAEQELAASELQHHEMVNQIRRDVAERYAELIQTRERILLLSDGVLPQAGATVESSTVAYQAGQVEFLSLLEAQAVLFRHEIDLAQQLADFGRELAGLERAVGSELEWE